MQMVLATILRAHLDLAGLLLAWRHKAWGLVALVVMLGALTTVVEIAIAAVMIVCVPVVSRVAAAEEDRNAACVRMTFS